MNPAHGGLVIAGTGHRPNKLGGYGKDAAEKLTQLCQHYLQYNKSIISLVITGGAIGYDHALALACDRTGIPFCVYAPFPGQELRWPVESQNLHKYILSKSRFVHFCSDGPYAAYKMLHRNRRMVDDCSVLLSCWDGTTGGTFHAVMYARKIGRPIVNMYSDWQQLGGFK